jgi:coniferyl-aldehyde dehydrogenase
LVYNWFIIWITSLINCEVRLARQYMATSKHDLKELLQIQQDAFRRQPFPSEKLRITQLKALKIALLKHKDKLIKAISADFGHRSKDETQLADIMPTILSIGYHIKHLRNWMKPEKRHVSALFQPASSQIMFQPLGVIGIMAPWNYPVFLTLGPLIAAIASGNRAMIKPSEFTPYSNRILNDIVNEAFSKDEVAIVEGEAEIAAAFSALPFDHLIFTGSTTVGKHVMAAAAKNLTPVTLELGGKSPAIIADDVTTDFAVERLLYGKCLNSGQTCVAPDYVLCPESKLDELVASLKKGFTALYPDLSCGDYSSVINERQYSRLKGLIEDAKARGAVVISLADQPESQLRCLPLQLIIGANDKMEVMQEEIFGPILPILTYKNIDEAISFIQAKARPLALYLYSLNKKTQNQVLMQTHAGGVCINDSVNHVAQEDLPFGGVGGSGMGKYHGKEGFLSFSAAKPILKRGRIYSAKAAFPPYNRFIHKIIYHLFLK